MFCTIFFYFKYDFTCKQATKFSAGTMDWEPYPYAQNQEDTTKKTMRLPSSIRW